MKKQLAILVIVINDNDEILLLKRASHKKYFPNKWAGVAAGPISKSTDIKKFALSEVRDELGVSGKIILKDDPIITKMNNEYWKIYLYLAKIESKSIKLNKEHTEFKWVKVDELSDYEIIPGREKNFKKIINKYKSSK